MISIHFSSRFFFSVLMLATITSVGTIADAEEVAVAGANPAEVPVQLEEKIESAPLAGYDKGFFIRDDAGLFELKINARFQARYSFESLEEHVEGADPTTGDTVVLSTDREAENVFSIPSARLKFKGHLFSKRIKYAFQTDWGKGGVLLKDFYGDFALVPKVLLLRVGQWVKPYSRQQITSSGKLELTGRAITDKGFGAGRDIGIAFHNNYEKSPVFEWAVGVFNGTGEKPWFSGELETDDVTGDVTGISSKSKFTNVPDEFNPALIARVGYNYGDLKGYSEVDFEGGPLRFGLGLSGVVDFDSDRDDEEEAAVRGEFDFIAKAHGFSASGGVYVWSTQDERSDAFSDQFLGAWGFHGQTGILLGKMFQPVVRYAMMDERSARGGDMSSTQEITGGFSVYFFKHNLKWQTDGGALLREDSDGNLSDVLVRTQLQLGF